MTRLLIASNRLPTTVELNGEEFRLSPSTGGLATGLRGICSQQDALWIGWPGDLDGLVAEQKRRLDEELAKRHLAALYLSPDEVRGYYDDISNSVLWPLLHGQIDQLSPDLQGWDEFVRVNQKFADAVAGQYRKGDLIWVQDFHLCLVPQMLRSRLPRAAIGFFLHTPFPSYDVFSVLAWREQILQGLLGADLIGFHTQDYCDNFATALRRLLAADIQGQQVQRRDRGTTLAVFPMGIDAAAWNSRSEDPDILRDVEKLRRDAGGRSLLLGIDRLDYTKGIVRRCLAVAHLFSMDEHLDEHLRLIQVTVPSRERVEAYATLQRSVDETVGRINAAHTSASAVPIHRIHSSLSERELSVLYRAADVMLVTALRDGMNLVAKEFVASRADEDGVLVLSEFTGAAAELKEALMVNPYDIEGTASVTLRALTMPREERRERMRSLRARVLNNDVHRWVRAFTQRLTDVATPQGSLDLGAQLNQITEQMQTSKELVLFLDYDGTLVPFAGTPDDAAPDEELLALLRDLAARPNIQLHLVSGRTKASMEAWFHDLPIGLHAEHGLWSRPPGGEWQIAQHPPSEWKTVVRPILDRVSGEMPGTFTEEKTAGLAWHYRQAVGVTASSNGVHDAQARELAALLTDLLANAPVDVVFGKKVIEIRPQNVDKGTIVPGSLEAAKGLVVAIGDDKTDEDLFGALPEGTLSVRVGDGETSAQYRVRSFTDVRALLSALRARP